MPDLSGTTLGKYRLIERLGRGGMAEVYRAYQPNLEREVAVKVMHGYLAEDQAFVGRFRREAKAVAALHHPHIVQVFDFDSEGDTYYMVMEYVRGETLKARIERLNAEGRRMPLSEVAAIMRALGAALDYAHAHGCIHRDLKPANIMFDGDRLVLTDFGIATIVGATRYTATGATIGTPAYMAPEQGQGEPGTARSDVYSLGVILYELVTGRLPFDADTPLAILLKHIRETLPMPSQVADGVPPAVEQVILKALAKAPEERYATAGALAAALEAALQGAPPQATLVQPAAPPAQPPIAPAQPIPAPPTPPPIAPAQPIPASPTPPPIAPAQPIPTPPTPPPTPAWIAYPRPPVQPPWTVPAAPPVPRAGIPLWLPIGAGVVAVVVVVSVVLVLLFGEFGPGPATPTAVPSAAASPPGPTLDTPVPTAQPTVPATPAIDQAEIESFLTYFAEVRQEAEKDWNTDLLRAVAVDPYLTIKSAKIEANARDGGHWETPSVHFTILTLTVTAADTIEVWVDKVETKLWYPRDSTLPDDQVCSGPIYSYRDCAYRVRYTLLRQYGRWYVSQAQDYGDCVPRCRR